MFLITKAIEILRETNDSVALAATLNNAADMYLNNENFDKSLAYLEEAGEIYSDLEYETGKAYVLGTEGMIYAEQGQDFLAETYINEAISVLEKTKNNSPISEFLIPMSDIYLRKNNHARAMEYAQKSLDLAESLGLVKQISEANFQLYKVHVYEGDLEKAIVNLKDFYSYRDSVLNIDKVQQMIKERQEILLEICDTTTEPLHCRTSRWHCMLGLSNSPSGCPSAIISRCRPGKRRYRPVGKHSLEYLRAS